MLSEKVLPPPTRPVLQKQRNPNALDAPDL